MRVESGRFEQVLNALAGGSEESWSAQMMAQVFGPLVGGGDTLFSVTIGWFNVIVLGVGSLLFFYNVTAGVLQSAHEGVVLGKRWSSLWAPIRTLFAVGLMVPVPGLAGYNTAQAGIIYLARGSTSIASLMWSSAIPALLAGKVEIAASSPSLPTPFVGEVWNMMACIALADHQLQSIGSLARVIAPAATGENQRIVFATRIEGGGDSTGICGSIGTPAPPSFLSSAEHEDTRSAAIEAFTGAHQAALEALMQGVKPLVDEVLRSSVSHDGTQVEIADGLRQALIAANEKLQPLNDLIADVSGDKGEGHSQLQNYIENDTGQGWLAAGSYYMVLARIQNDVSSVVNAAPTVLTPPRYAYEATGSTLDSAASGRWQGLFGSANASNLPLDQEEVVRIGGDFERAFLRASSKLQSFGFGLPDPALAAALTPAHGEGGSVGDVLQGAVDDVGRQLSQKVALYFSPSEFGNDPMVGLVALGQFLIVIAGIITTTLAVAAAVPILGGGVMAAMSILGPLILAMTVTGGTMSVLLPAMPFLFWTLAVFSYFIALAGAIVAAPLWAIAHLRMDGEGVAPEGARQGYGLLLRLVLTPPLMLVELFAAMAIFRAVSSLIGVGIYYILSSFSGSVLHWLVSVVIMMCMTTAISLIVLERSFSLISTLPDIVLRWFDAGSNSSES